MDGRTQRKHKKSSEKHLVKTHTYEAEIFIFDASKDLKYFQYFQIMSFGNVALMAAIGYQCTDINGDKKQLQNQDLRADALAQLG